GRQERGREAAGRARGAARWRRAVHPARRRDRPGPGAATPRCGAGAHRQAPGCGGEEAEQRAVRHARAGRGGHAGAREGGDAARSTRPPFGKADGADVSFREVAALGAAAVAVLFACARAYPPPGGEEDRIPPRIVSITPEPMSVGVARNARVVIRFDERISERGLEGAVLVSPQTSAVRVDRGRSALRVSLRDGWEPDRIYHVVVQPVVRDLFGNTITEPLEVVFST